MLSPLILNECSLSLLRTPKILYTSHGNCHYEIYLDINVDVYLEMVIDISPHTLDHQTMCSLKAEMHLQSPAQHPTWYLAHSRHPSRALLLPSAHGPRSPDLGHRQDIPMQVMLTAASSMPSGHMHLANWSSACHWKIFKGSDRD